MIKKIFAIGLDHKSAQDQVLNSAIGIAEVGRIFKLSYPWKCKLNQGNRRCPKILPGMTLAQIATRNQSTAAGRHPAVDGSTARAWSGRSDSRRRRRPS